MGKLAYLPIDFEWIKERFCNHRQKTTCPIPKYRGLHQFHEKISEMKIKKIITSKVLNFNKILEFKGHFEFKDFKHQTWIRTDFNLKGKRIKRIHLYSQLLYPSDLQLNSYFHDSSN